MNTTIRVCCEPNCLKTLGCYKNDTKRNCYSCRVIESNCPLNHDRTYPVTHGLCAFHYNKAMKKLEKRRQHG